MRRPGARPNRSAVDDIIPVVDDIRQLLAELRVLAAQAVKDPDERHDTPLP